MKSSLRKVNHARTSVEGFTLVETIVVLAILSILVSWSVKFYLNLESYQMRQVAKEIKYLIEDTKQVATLTNGAYQVVCGSKDGNYYLVQKSEGSTMKKLNLPKDIDAGIGAWYDIPQDDSELVNNRKFMFYADMSPSESGTLRLRHQKTKEVIEITVQPVTGYVTIYES